MDIRDASQVAEARREAVAQAQGLGFAERDGGRVAIVVTELATNLLKHGGGGTLLVGSFADETGSGMECLALDRGAGMDDVAASMRVGHSTAGSPGTGLGAVSRGAHVMDVYSRPGAGTAILVRLEQGDPKRAPKAAMPAYGSIAVPVAGEEVSGDAWCRAARDDGWMAMIADGLGHGPNAAEAAQETVRQFTAATRAGPGELLATMHGALRSTRGAAVSIAQLDRAGDQIVFAGVGNVAGALVRADGEVRRMVCNNGTVGHIAKHMREFTYPLAAAALLVMASDGLTTGWRLDPYPGLLTRHPTLIAGVLYRDFNRGRDDVTILVSRLEAL